MVSRSGAVVLAICLFHGLAADLSAAPYSRDLARHVERTIRWQFGDLVKDIQVEVEIDGRKVIVKVDGAVRNPAVSQQVYEVLYTMPQLYGCRIRLNLELDE